MDALMRNVMPLILLMAFGAWLRRRRYFSEETVKQNMKLIGNVLASCILIRYAAKIRSSNGVYDSDGIILLPSCPFSGDQFADLSFLSCKEKIFPVLRNGIRLRPDGNSPLFFCIRSRTYGRADSDGRCA